MKGKLNQFKEIFLERFFNESQMSMGVDENFSLVTSNGLLLKETFQEVFGTDFDDFVRSSYLEPEDIDLILLSFKEIMTKIINSFSKGECVIPPFLIHDLNVRFINAKNKLISDYCKKNLKNNFQKKQSRIEDIPVDDLIRFNSFLLNEEIANMMFFEKLMSTFESLVENGSLNDIRELKDFSDIEIIIEKNKDLILKLIKNNDGDLIFNDGKFKYKISKERRGEFLNFILNKFVEMELYEDAIIIRDLIKNN